MSPSLVQTVFSLTEKDRIKWDFFLFISFFCFEDSWCLSYVLSVPFVRLCAKTVCIWFWIAWIKFIWFWVFSLCAILLHKLITCFLFEQMHLNPHLFDQLPVILSSSMPWASPSFFFSFLSVFLCLKWWGLDLGAIRPSPNLSAGLSCSWLGPYYSVGPQKSFCIVSLWSKLERSKGQRGNLISFS